MDDTSALSFYLGKQTVETLGNLDIPLSNGQIVSINLINELPDDPYELITFLETESCPKKFWISVAQAYAQKNKLNGSLEVIKKALSLSQFNENDKLSFSSFLSWLYLKFVSQGINKQENLINASNEINKISNHESTNISTFLSKAILYLYKDQPDQAIVIFDRLLKIDHNNCFALLGKANIILNKTKNYTNALKLYQQVLLLNPLINPDPRIGIGLCFWFLKDEEMAIKSWNRSLELNPNNLKARILLTFSKFNQVFNNSLSDDHFKEGYKAVLEELSLIYDENKNDNVILLSLASFYYSKGNFGLVETIVTKVIQSVSGDSTASIKLTNSNKLSKFQSNLLSQASFWLGRISFAKNDFTQSQRCFHESIKLNENNLLAKLGLGQSQIGRGSIEEATITYESILKTNLKCLEVNYSLGCLYSQEKSRRKQEQAIQILERYLRLSDKRGLHDGDGDDSKLNKEPVALNAYLILSQLYETRDVGQSLNYLNKAIESRKTIGEDAPLEVYNNIGVFNFIKNNYKLASENFELALEKAKSRNDFKSQDGDLLIDLPNDLQVSLTFNLARSKELVNDGEESIKAYENLLKECPNYFSAKLRLLFLDGILTNNSTKEEIKTEIETLLNLSASDLEIRSFYGWFVKNFGKKLGLSPDTDTTHQKDTLVEYNSHDCYALISLANIYCVMARDIKGSNQDEKKKKYYIRAVELFAKVLSVDSKDVYAAQGLAIVYIENKDLSKGLDILRKIRDSLNDISIYLNLGHVLVDLKQYTKAIENYEIALIRYLNEKDSKILTFLGRAWYLRGSTEKNLSFLKKALDYSQDALDNSLTVKSPLKFNLAYIQFQIAEFVSKLPVEQRNVEDINETIVNLNEAIKTFNELASDDEKHPPYPKSELKARAALGTNTLLNRLSTTLEETKENINKVEEKLESAKKLRQKEADTKLRLEEEKVAALKIKEAELSKERAKLQEQAQQWAEEARMDVVVDEEDDDKLFDEETNAEQDKSKTKGKKSAGGKTNKKGKNKKRGKKSKLDESDDEPSPSEEESEAEAPRKKRSAIEDDNDEDDADDNSSKKKKARLSKETISDSDDDLDDDLFNEAGAEEENGDVKSDHHEENDEEKEDKDEENENEN